MKRRIHITESQLKEIFKHINENNKLNNEVIEEEAQVTIDGNPYAASNGGNLDLARKDAAKNAVDSGVKLDNANISFDMQESLKKVTKKHHSPYGRVTFFLLYRRSNSKYSKIIKV